MREELQKKVDRAIKLIQQAGRDGQVVEVDYSGGKDSDVILELTKMSGINYRAIYKNTTIDPPHTIAHAKEMGAEIMPPKYRFFELVEQKGSPSRFIRYCCAYLKEYKILDRAIMGVRKAESTKRAAMYNEPTQCRFYGSKKEHVEAFYPILEWSNQDVVDFIEERGIKVHPLYYREDGSIDASRRVGCMCCPLASVKKRLQEFKKYPRMLRLYLKAMKKFRETHPDSRNVQRYSDIYEWAVREMFYEKQSSFEEKMRGGLFEHPDYKQLLEEYFKIDLTL